MRGFAVAAELFRRVMVAIFCALPVEGMSNRMNKLVF